METSASPPGGWRNLPKRASFDGQIMLKTALHGVKILSFEWIVLGPLATSLLGALGATVVKAESHVRPDGGRFIGPFKDGIVGPSRGGFFAHQNASKYSITVNLKNPSGLALIHRLCGWADVIMENMTPGVMGKLGLDYAAVQRINPGIIYISTSVQGQHGPYATATGFGQLAAALSGCTQLSSWADRGPAPCHGAYVDYFTARWLPSAVLAALDYRRRSGRGQYIDNSILENTAYFFSLPVMDYAVNGRVWNRDGNRNPGASPHGAFRCLGDDRWVAIAVTEAAEWQSFCGVVEKPEWITDPRFATLAARKQHEDELEALVNTWTAGHTAEQVESMMQAAGIPASVVQTTREVLADPQLNQRGTFRELEHLEIGPLLHICSASRFSKNEPDWRAAPAIGEHNETVLRDFIGLTDEDIADLYAQGGITTEADYPF